MKKGKAIKRALVSSIVSIVLCVAMLIGTTFAWFTDTASTAVNKIQVGTLDVELEMKNADGEWVSAVGETMEFKKASTENGTEVLWEPGCTYELPALRVVNEGNLAFKYRLVVSGAIGDTKLLEAIEFTVVDSEGNKTTLTDMEGILLPEGKTPTKGTDEKVKYSDANGIIIKGHMKEEAGNEYQNLSVSGIAVTVYAEQYTYEYDSYDKMYDEQAEGIAASSPFTNYVNVTATKATGTDTVLKDNEISPTITATIPASSTNATSLTLIKKPTANPGNITIATTDSMISADVKIIDQDENVVTAADGTFFKIEVQLGANLDVLNFYHDGVQLDKVDSADQLTVVDKYYYDVDAGTVTFTTDDFSVFSAEYKYAGGLGTEDKPYLIDSAGMLAAFAKSVNNGNTYEGNTITLTKSIDLENREWTPIGEKGTTGTKFEGTFDGGDHTISGLNVTTNSLNTDHDGYGALFGAIEGNAVVKNLTVSGTVTCENAAGVVARMNKGTVKNCTSNVTVTGSAKAGGIVCLTNTSGCTIENCTNNGTVSGPTTTGGIAAMVNSNTTVEGCTNNGTIGGDSSQIAGGIVATINSKWTNVHIESCTNNAAVTSKSSDKVTGKSGGIVGNVEAGAASGCSGTIKNCSNSGTISSTGDNSASGDIVGNIVDDLGIELTVENNGCNSNDFSGTGTASDPYIIDSVEKLSKLSANVASGKIYCYQYFKLSNNLDMNNVTFTPIGNSTYSFKGTFDGNSKTISNLNISSTTASEPLGLFVSTNRATIKDLTLKDVTVSGTTKVGALVGSMKGGTVSNVTLSGTSYVTSSSYYAGGIIGYAESAMISSCTNSSTGEVKEDADNDTGVGGIIGGALKNTTVKNCTNSCNVSGPKDAGGIVGQVSAGTVSGCTNSGAVTVSKNYAGGIVGLALLETVASKNTNSGTVTATQKYAGGIVGAAVLNKKATADMTISSNTNSGTLVTTSGNYTDGIVAFKNSDGSSYSINVS